jgi:long-chain acyl-CoA synthetase
MKGYRKNQEANDEVFFYIDGKRFFKTGDLGRMVDGKFLKITGRIKEQFKLENGKYVVPAVLEDQVSRAPLILQTVIYGDNRAHCIALIVPDMVELRSWAEAEGMASLSDTEVMESDKLKEKMSKDIAESSYAMKSFEKPLKWIYTLEPFSQENQLLTPKMSLRRNHVLKIYLPQIEEVFAGKAGVALKDYGIQTGGTDDA